MPHARTARRDAREIAEAAAGIREDVGIRTLDARQHLDEAERKQVRQMRGCGEDRVVARRIHAHDTRAGGLPQRLDLPQRRVILLRMRRQNQAMPAKQAGQRMGDTAFFRAGDRMRRDEARRHFTKHLRRRIEHRLLGAADIRDDGLIAQARLAGSERRSRREHRHGDHRDIGPAHRIRSTAGAEVDDTEFLRQADLLGIGIEAAD